MSWTSDRIENLPILFEDGDRGKNYIECHHNTPVSGLNEGDVTKLSDLTLLCSNCHRIIHRKKPWLTIDELREIFN